jgi:hypothetical protein
MKPKIKSGQQVTISPDLTSLEIGDVLFCKVKGNFYVHLLTATKDEQYQISNNHGHINGWISKNSIYGKIIKVED